MKLTGTEFIKPYGREIFGRDTVAHYAYPREALTGEDIYPYFVLDGGAHNLARDVFGAATGEVLLKLTESGELFDYFRSGGKYNWEASFKYTEGTGFRKKYEWQIWPQRLYMTLPVAQAFLRTGERRSSDLWLEIVRGWDEAHPYQPFDPEIHYLQTDMVWRDMQVAWRTLSLLHGVFMLSDAPFDREEWEYIYGFIKLHVDHLYGEAQDRLRRNHAQNHVLQIGVALIMAGVMFPELENAAELIKIGRDTVEMNMRHAIFPDGGSDEDSPSYSHFIVRLYLEALLLLRRNGLDEIEGLADSIVRQYEWIYHISAPDGSCLMISDSYGMDSLADLRRAEALIDLPFDRRRSSRLFVDSNVCVIKKGNLSLYVDAMDRCAGHRHYGRPQLLLFCGDAPVIIDSGCCSYDRWELYNALRSASAHNVVFSPDLREDDAKVSCSITEFNGSGGFVTTVATVTDGTISYEWERRITVTENTVIIRDKAISETPVNWRLHHHFLRADTERRGNFKVFRLTPTYGSRLECSLETETELVPVMDRDNAVNYAVRVFSKGYGRVFEAVTTIGISC